MSWATLADARAPGVWPDAAGIDDAALTALLADVTAVLAARCRPLRDPADPLHAEQAARYTRACVYAARDFWAARALDGGLVDFGEYARRLNPLTPAVEALLNPPRRAVAR